MQFDHERLDVYRVALAFIVVANDVAQALPRGRSYIAHQLQRAATSVIPNLAEGAGEYSANDKARFYSHEQALSDGVRRRTRRLQGTRARHAGAIRRRTRAPASYRVHAGPARTVSFGHGHGHGHGHVRNSAVEASA
jgi:hypothetical protein